MLDRFMEKYTQMQSSYLSSKSIGIIFYIPPISKAQFSHFLLALWGLLYQCDKKKMPITTEVRVPTEKHVSVENSI